jgi:hypothetical protein
LLLPAAVSNTIRSEQSQQQKLIQLLVPTSIQASRTLSKPAHRLLLKSRRSEEPAAVCTTSRSDRISHHVELFTLNHIPALFVATALTFGGMVPIFDAKFAIRETGFSQRLYNSKEAQSIMTLGMGRTTVIGLALYTYYFQGKFVEEDTLLSILGAYLGAIDAYVCVKEGVAGKAVFRGSSGAVIATIGWFGTTSWA